MEFKDINELITKLEDEFDTIEKANPPRKHSAGWKLRLATDKYYYVNCRLKDILTSEEELREAYYQVYLKLFSIYLKRLVKKNNDSFSWNRNKPLVETRHLCYVIDHRYIFSIENCCNRKAIFEVVKYNDTNRYLTNKYNYYDSYWESSEYCDEVLHEAIQLVHDTLGKQQFEKEVYRDRVLLERPVENGWQKIVLCCLEYFQEGELKDELYLECVLS